MGKKKQKSGSHGEFIGSDVLERGAASAVSGTGSTGLVPSGSIDSAGEFDRAKSVNNFTAAKSSKKRK